MVVRDPNASNRGFGFETSNMSREYLKTHVLQLGLKP